MLVRLKLLIDVARLTENELLPSPVRLNEVALSPRPNGLFAIAPGASVHGFPNRMSSETPRTRAVQTAAAEAQTLRRTALPC